MKNAAAADITWTTTNLSLDRIARYFGMGVAREGHAFIAQVVMAKGRDAALAHCRCNATGAWDANERESHAMWKSLAGHIEAGSV